MPKPQAQGASPEETLQGQGGMPENKDVFAGISDLSDTFSYGADPKGEGSGDEVDVTLRDAVISRRGSLAGVAPTSVGPPVPHMQKAPHPKQTKKKSKRARDKWDFSLTHPGSRYCNESKHWLPPPEDVERGHGPTFLDDVSWDEEDMKKRIAASLLKRAEAEKQARQETLTMFMGPAVVLLWALVVNLSAFQPSGAVFTLRGFAARVSPCSLLPVVPVNIVSSRYILKCQPEIEPEETFPTRWAKWAADFEELVEGPWV